MNYDRFKMALLSAIPGGLLNAFFGPPFIAIGMYLLKLPMRKPDCLYGSLLPVKTCLLGALAGGIASHDRSPGSFFDPYSIDKKHLVLYLLSSIATEAGAGAWGGSDIAKVSESQGAAAGAAGTAAMAGIMIGLPMGYGIVVGVGNCVYIFIKRVLGICHGRTGDLYTPLAQTGATHDEIVEIAIAANQQAGAAAGAQEAGGAAAGEEFVDSLDTCPFYAEQHSNQFKVQALPPKSDSKYDNHLPD